MGQVLISRKVNLASSAIDPTWNPKPEIALSRAVSAYINTLAFHDNTLFVGGGFGRVGGLARSCLAAVSINDTGSAIETRDAQSDQEVYALAASGSSLYVGGKFTSIGGQPRKNLAALGYDTGKATAWNPHVVDTSNPTNTTADIRSLSADDTTVYVGGYLTEVNGLPTPNLAGINTSLGMQVFLPLVSRN